MRLEVTVSILAAIGWQGYGRSTPVAVDVYISDRTDSSQLWPGTPIASGIFAAMGVRVKWHTGELPTVRGGGRNAAGQAAFGIHTVERAPLSATPGALASSQLPGAPAAEIAIYRDRVRYFLEDHPSLRGVAIGYVLAHELAHVMQGVVRHSESGIMKAKWSSSDFKEMMYLKLAFTQFDVTLVHQGLAFQLVSRRIEPEAESRGTFQIRVCVTSNNQTSPIVLTRAQRISSQTFATAGVALEWHSTGSAACREARQTDIVILNFTTNMTPGQHPGALAYSQVYEDHVVVMFDRIEKNADGPTQVSTLLANVMTHEITHVLQRVSRHSLSGVMKAHWDATDFLQMTQIPLPLAPEDIDLIQRGLRLRAPGAGSGVSQ